ncbi:diiron oxygenase [Streptomyces griseoruber]|uniref:AurF domain containing protein n=1 Tax=Streptomyces griseoruber TaxID=1943 RepID=A0A117RGB4_9ACTN|nr:diiron oxygenase [Streptomyces griseoruber]KUN89250.1 AurF domain containing protein [Streptomyces griseoruber]
MSVSTIWDSEMTSAVERLARASVDDYYNPYQKFEWPDAIPQDAMWMSPHLLTVHGTTEADGLTSEQLRELSRWESIHFYSLNVHGIRELLLEVVQRIHTPGFEVPTPFFHHFLGEENEHMWFFAEFCLRYGKKLYEDRSLQFPQEDTSPLVANFLVFSRILIFEQIVDYFNSTMAADESLPETIRAINRIHHQDESRHIAFGGQLVRTLYQAVLEKSTAEEIASAREYVSRYIDASVAQLYSVDVYKDAGLPDPYGLRRRLLADPARQPAHDRITARTRSFYRRIGVLDTEVAS